jgi:hypothetical protein
MIYFIITHLGNNTMQAAVPRPRRVIPVNPYSGDPEYVAYIHEIHRCGDCRNTHLPGTECSPRTQTAKQDRSSHPPKPAQMLPKALTECRFYASGYCRKGNYCPFLQSKKNEKFLLSHNKRRKIYILISIYSNNKNFIFSYYMFFYFFGKYKNSSFF